MVIHSAGCDLARKLDDDIRSGRLAPGARLPSTAELALAHGVTVHAMQSALAHLHERGLLTRSRRRGTFVALNVGSSVIGVVMGRNLLTDPNLRVYGLTIDHLTQAVVTRGFQLRLYLPGAGQDQRRDLERDLDAGHLRALIVLAREPGTAALLAGLDQVPVVDFPLPDYPLLAYLGMRHLLAAQVQRIGIIPPDPDIGTAAFQAGVERALAEAGGGSAQLTWFPGGNRQETGIGAVQASRGAPPDSWLVGDDNATRGLVGALLVAGTRLPGGLRLVTHANRGLEIFPPLALTRLEIDPLAAANALCANLAARLEGSAPPVITLAPTLVVGDT